MICIGHLFIANEILIEVKHALEIMCVMHSLMLIIRMKVHCGSFNCNWVLICVAMAAVAKHSGAKPSYEYSYGSGITMQSRFACNWNCS